MATGRRFILADNDLLDELDRDYFAWEGNATAERRSSDTEFSADSDDSEDEDVLEERAALDAFVENQFPPVVESKGIHYIHIIHFCKSTQAVCFSFTNSYHILK